MKHSTTRTLLFLLPGLAAAAQVAPQMPTTNGTVALYQFDEGSGTTASDTMGAYPASFPVSNPPGWTVLDGRTSLDCTPASSLIYPSPMIPVGANWTIQAVVHLPVAANPDTFNHLAGWGMNWSHVVLKDNELGLTRAGTFFGSGHSIAGLTGWHLISAVGSGSETAFYVDAEPVGSPAEQQITDAVWGVGGINADRPWGGPIDCIRFLNVVRSAQEIADDAVALIPPAGPPPAPQIVGQFDLAGLPINPGGSTRDRFTIEVVVASGSGANIRVDVAVKPVNISFDGNASDIRSQAGLSGGMTATVAITGLVPGSYHWQARAGNVTGDSPWVSFGANPDIASQVDVMLVTNLAPTSGPAGQLLASDGSAIVADRYFFDSNTVRLAATLFDADADLLVLQVELRPTGTPFSGQPTATSAPVMSGATATCEVTLTPGSYAWQSRAVDALGAASAWTHFGGGASADLVVKSAGSTGVTGCVGSAAGIAPGWVTLLAVLTLSRLGQIRKR